MLSKICSKCKIEKRLGEFHKQKKGKNGFRSECKECNCKRATDYYYNYNKGNYHTTHKAEHKAYYLKNKERIIETGKTFYKNIKLQIINHYGNACVGCGITNIDLLTIDHINNDGAERRKNGEGRGTGLYSFIVKQNFPIDLQILCHNCQHLKVLKKLILF